MARCRSSFRFSLALVVVLLGALAAAAAWKRRSESLADDAPAPTWPPFEQPDVPSVPETIIQPFAAAMAEPVAEPSRWVLPVDGACPPGYPIKANDNSRIFHVPGGRFYDRTVAERCYATEDDAAADGYRRAKA